MRAFAEWLQATPFSMWIQTTSWVVPLVQSIHIITIGVVFVSILSIALRVLGLVRTDQTPAQTVERFAKWIGYGLIVMVVSGVVLVIGEPIRQQASTSFWLKMTLLVVAVASAYAFRAALLKPATEASAGAGFTTAAKAMAAGTVALWLFIIFLGRAIAYDIEVWGPLSLSYTGA